MAAGQRCRSKISAELVSLSRGRCHRSDRRVPSVRCTIRLCGELDLATVAPLRAVLQSVCAGESHLVVVDLVSHADALTVRVPAITDRSLLRPGIAVTDRPRENWRQV